MSAHTYGVSLPIGRGILKLRHVNVTFINNDKSQEFVITIWRGESNQVCGKSNQVSNEVCGNSNQVEGESNQVEAHNL